MKPIEEAESFFALKTPISYISGRINDSIRWSIRLIFRYWKRFLLPWLSAVVVGFCYSFDIGFSILMAPMALPMLIGLLWMILSSYFVSLCGKHLEGRYQALGPFIIMTFVFVWFALEDTYVMFLASQRISQYVMSFLCVFAFIVLAIWNTANNFPAAGPNLSRRAKETVKKHRKKILGLIYLSHILLILSIIEMYYPYDFTVVENLSHSQCYSSPIYSKRGVSYDIECNVVFDYRGKQRDLTLLKYSDRSNLQVTIRHGLFDHYSL
jgi:hypothetical protein